MLTFYHAPLSRSGRVDWLLHELGVRSRQSAATFRETTARVRAIRETRTLTAKCPHWSMTAR